MQKPDLRTYLGRRVEVVIDRPLGSQHPRLPGLRYLVNYGELPGTTSGDGHPIDAYVIGPRTPVASATGMVVAVVVRDDDAEDKLVVSTEGVPISATEVWEKISFQEQYFWARLILLGG